MRTHSDLRGRVFTALGCVCIVAALLFSLDQSGLLLRTHHLVLVGSKAAGSSAGDVDDPSIASKPRPIPGSRSEAVQPIPSSEGTSDSAPRVRRQRLEEQLIRDQAEADALRQQREIADQAKRVELAKKQQELDDAAALQAAKERELADAQARLQADRERAQQEAADRLQKLREEEMARPKPAPTYHGPSSGTLVWEGFVDGSQLVTIDGDTADVGRVVEGSLPGVAVLVQPADPKHVRIASAPAPSNDFHRVVFGAAGKGQSRVVLRWSVP
jgi:hypothetical protein